MSAPDNKSIILVLRSLANSRKEASLADLARDYAETEGGQIPFVKYGFKRLEDFLRDSGEFRVTPWQTVQVKCSETSSHINKLVSEQKSTPKRYTKMQPQRKIHSPANNQRLSTQQPTVYSNGFQSMKLRSPMKYPSQRQIHNQQPLEQHPTQNNSHMFPTQNYQQQKSNHKVNGNFPHNRSQVAAAGPRNNQPNVNDKPQNQNNSSKISAAPKAEKPVLDLRERINRKTISNKIKSNNQSSMFTLSSQRTEPGNSQMTEKTIASVNPNYQDPVKTSAIETPPQLQVVTESTEAPKTSRLQQRLQITIKPDMHHTREVVHYQNGLDPSSSTTMSPIELVSALPISGLMPTISKSKLSDRLKQRTSVHSSAQLIESTTTTSVPIPLETPTPTNADSLHIDRPFKKDFIQDPITVLATYSKTRGYGIPEYKILRMPKSNRLQCRVMINNISYSSYPHDFESVREAKLFTAVETLAQFKQHEQQQKYPVCMDLESELIVKLFECLKDSAHGVFIKNIPDLFQNTNRQTLPANWEKLIMKTQNLFTVAESIENNLIVYPNMNNQVAMPNPSAQTTSTASSSLGIQTTTMGTPPNTSVSETNTNSSIKENEGDVIASAVISNANGMDKLELPWNEKYWNIFITNPKSTVEIWGRLIGSEYSDLMDNLIVDIELDLMQDKVRPTTVKVGDVYLIVVSECTYRARVDRLDFGQSRCLCFYIDNGDEEWFPLDQIYVCKEQFLVFPAQAVCLSLFGLEDCAENPNAQTHLDNVLTSKTLVAEVASKRHDYEAQEMSADETPRIVVALYDTSSDDDVQLNNVILDKICEDCTAPTLRPIGITNVIISCVTENGDVYCQLRTSSGGIHYVQKLIHHLVQFGFNPEQHRYSVTDDIVAAPRLDGSQAQPPVYLVQDPDDHKWYRACILKKEADKCEMFYVDFGMTRYVQASKISRLDSMCVVLYKYPFQAIACRLYEVQEVTSSMVASLRCYLSTGTPAMFKVMSTRHKIPIVKIFIRYQDGPLVYINDTIQLEEEIENTPEIDDNVLPIFASNLAPQPAISSRPPSSNGQNTMSLPRFEMPEIGKKFEVHVTMASNPHNFKVQPHRQIPVFQKLMLELQDYCSRTPQFVVDEEVQAGEVYACQQTDNIWYRAVVQNICSASMFLINYCDYGDIVVVNSDRLKILPAAYRQMPALAINAKLFGLTPKNQDWETEDCLQFQRLTVDKSFVSMVHKVLSGGNNDKSAQLELTLYDVSTDKDIDINQMLILEDRAVAVA